MLSARLASLVIGYLFGLITTGYFYAKYKHVDIRSMGSGNIGTTNTFRTLGKKAGIIVFLGDGFKGIFAIAAIWLLFHARYPDNILLLEAYAGLGAVLGHNFPIHLKFHGGKGIATTAGMLLAVNPWAVPVCAALFFGSLFIKKYVSVGSLLICLGFFIQTLIFGQKGMFPLEGQYLTEFYIVVGTVCLLGVLRHQSNIKRLLNGTENKAFIAENK